jgi:hypothetical protein
MGIRGFLAGDLLTNRETSARFHDGVAEAGVIRASLSLLERRSPPTIVLKTTFWRQP